MSPAALYAFHILPSPHFKVCETKSSRPIPCQCVDAMLVCLNPELPTPRQALNDGDRSIHLSFLLSRQISSTAQELERDAISQHLSPIPIIPDHNGTLRRARDFVDSRQKHLCAIFSRQAPPGMCDLVLLPGGFDQETVNLLVNLGKD